MPRPKRIALGGYVYHVLNRANGRLRMFRKESDFLAFEKILGDGTAPWLVVAATRLQLQPTLQPRERPRKCT